MHIVVANDSHGIYPLVAVHQIYHWQQFGSASVAFLAPSYLQFARVMRAGGRLVIAKPDEAFSKRARGVIRHGSSA